MKNQLVVSQNNQQKDPMFDQNSPIYHASQPFAEQNLLADIKTLKELVTELLKAENVTYLGLFGSYARGDSKKTSDLDMIVTFERTPSMFKLLDLEDKLQKATGKKIDLLTHDSINPLLEPNIKKDLITLYERL